MYGQDTGGLPFVLVPDSYPTRAEQAKWDELLDLVDDCTDKVYVCRLLGANAAASFFWGQKHGFNVKKPVELEKRVVEAEVKLDNLKNVIRKVEDHDFTIQFNKGDIDIVDPSQNLDGWPIILAGFVIVVGVISLADWIWDELDDCQRNYRILDRATDKVFCTEGTPETCAEWKAYKVESGLEERKKLAEGITSGLGKKLKTGAQWGIAVAIPLIVLAFLWRSRK